jgi:hypothetical protein
VHPIVTSEPDDQVEQLGLRDRRRQPVAEGADADLATRTLLAPDVDLGRAVVTNENGRETRLDAAGRELRCALPHLAPHRRRHCFAVDRPSHDAGFQMPTSF